MNLSFHKSKIPIYYIYFSIILLILNFHFESNIFIWFPDLLLIFIALILNLKYSTNQIRLFAFCIFLVMKDLLIAQKIYSSPIISIIFSSIIFLQIFNKYCSKIEINKYIKYISYFLYLNLIFIFIETLSFNLKSNFIALLYNGVYKPAFDVYGKVPQSIFNQSQAGGQIIILNIFWLLLMIKFNFKNRFLFFIMLFISIYVLFLYPNSTSIFILLFILLIFHQLLLPNKYFIYATVLFSSILIYDFITNLFYYKIFNQVGDISNSYFSPIENFIKITLFEKFFGIADQNKLYELEADFTYGILLLNNGLVVFIFLIIIMFYILRKYTIRNFLTKNLSTINNKYILLNKYSMLFILTSLLSLIHYPFIINFGARQLFSLNIALFIYTYSFKSNENQLSSINNNPNL